jgi:hypothetical protein
MLLVSPDYFDRMSRRRGDDDAETLEERRRMRNLLKHAKGDRQHPYEQWVKVREVLDPLLRRARERRRSVPLPLYEIAAGKSSGGEIGVPMDESVGVARPDASRRQDEQFVGDYVVPNGDDDDDIIVRSGANRFGAVAAPYLARYVTAGRSVDRVYGIRREADGNFVIGDSRVSVDEAGDVTVRGATYGGTAGLWELLTKTDVDRALVTPDDMMSYKLILESTSGHLSGNDPSGSIKSVRGPKYRDVISKLFPADTKRRRRERRWTPNTQ